MVGFRVGNTMTENGSVSRGVCENNDGLLTSVVERKSIVYNPEHEIVFTDENGKEQKLAPNTPVSMNMWGFTPDYFDFAEREFRDFLLSFMPTVNTLKACLNKLDCCDKTKTNGVCHADMTCSISSLAK